MKYNDLIDELLNLLDMNDDIIKIRILKNKLLEDEKLKNDINNYHLTKSIESKKRLFSNPDYLEYLECETRLNFLIHDIKNKFNFNSRKCNHESN